MFKSLEKMPYFTIGGLANLLNKPSDYCSIVASRWRKRGYILAIKKGVYVTTEYKNRHIEDLDYLSSVATLIDPSSYVSSEYILQRYNILTEATYTVTSVTTKTTRSYKNNIGRFYYKNIRPELFKGYITKDYNGVAIKEAPLEKALFDYMYFRPLYHKGRKIKYDIAEEFRLNLDVFTPEQIEAFGKLCKESEIRKMDLVRKNFEETIWSHH